LAGLNRTMIGLKSIFTPENLPLQRQFESDYDRIEMHFDRWHKA